MCKKETMYSVKCYNFFNCHVKKITSNDYIYIYLDR